MILLLSDIHLGKDPSRREEEVLLKFLRSHEPMVEALYLVGDVFDQYIEYSELIPKGSTRFCGLLAEWTDGGIPVTYLAGNHDPWHVSYFQEELGVRFVLDELFEHLYGRNVYITHGDGRVRFTRRYNVVKPVLRHPIPVKLYRNMLPGDWGIKLARWVNVRFSDDNIKPQLVDQTRQFAREVLENSESEVVIMGHTHFPEIHAWPAGVYMNLGCWFERRIFGVINEDGPRLMRWEEEKVVPYLSEMSI